MNTLCYPDSAASARPRQRIGAYEVIADPHIFALRDDSLHTLHPIHSAQGDHMFLRGYESTSGAISVVDLRRLVATLAGELPHTHPVDVPGLIKFSLRGIYPSGHALQRAVNEHALTVGWPAARMQRSLVAA